MIYGVPLGGHTRSFPTVLESWTRTGKKTTCKDRHRASSDRFSLVSEILVKFLTLATHTHRRRHTSAPIRTLIKSGGELRWFLVVWCLTGLFRALYNRASGVSMHILKIQRQYDRKPSQLPISLNVL
jgi:hypothetical protein